MIINTYFLFIFINTKSKDIVCVNLKKIIGTGVVQMKAYVK